MTSATMNVAARHDALPADAREDWMLANPWLWLGAACALTGASWLWTYSVGAEASDGRVVLLAFGLLAGGVGVWLRWNDGRAVYLRTWQPPLTLFLGVVFAVAFVAVSGIFLVSLSPFASFWNWTLTQLKLVRWLPTAGDGLYSGALFLVWISAAPPTFLAARRCLKHSKASAPPGSGNAEAVRNEAVEKETAFAFIVAAALCFAGSFTLYADPANPLDWDTMRLFLRVVMAVALYASALALVSKAVRGIMLCVLCVLHCLGFNTAALSAPPAPWVIQQIWMRLFRPYLEFAYLNNAYHFYAPEPGPASYIWFRVIYEDPKTKAEEGLWYKIPQLDDDGRNLHPVALDYQRFLSLTEGIAGSVPAPLEKIVNVKTQQLEDNPFWVNRLRLANEATITIGQPASPHLRVPLHPFSNYHQQVKVPNEHSKKVLESYARYVARRFAVHPEPGRSDWSFKSVKVYHVVHTIPRVDWFVNEIPPTDPDLYFPFYLGNFEADGKPYRRRNPDGTPQVEKDNEGKPIGWVYESDPYLYWLLPAIRKALQDPDSEIHDYAREHAGDPQYIRRGRDKRWVTPAERDK
jgi:hypothetical protein